MFKDLFKTILFKIYSLETPWKYTHFPPIQLQINIAIVWNNRLLQVTSLGHIYVSLLYIKNCIVLHWDAIYRLSLLLCLNFLSTMMLAKQRHFRQTIKMSNWCLVTKLSCIRKSLLLKLTKKAYSHRHQLYNTITQNLSIQRAKIKGFNAVFIFAVTCHTQHIIWNWTQAFTL